MKSGSGEKVEKRKSPKTRVLIGPQSSHLRTGQGDPTLGFLQALFPQNLGTLRVWGDFLTACCLQAHPGGKGFRQPSHTGSCHTGVYTQHEARAHSAAFVGASAGTPRGGPSYFQLWFLLKYRLRGSRLGPNTAGKERHEKQINVRMEAFEPTPSRSGR